MKSDYHKLIKKTFLLFLFFLCMTFHSYAQQFAISGKEFYVAFGRNDTVSFVKNVVDFYNVELVLRFTSIFDSDVRLAFTENSALDTTIQIKANVIYDFHLSTARARASYSGFMTTAATNKKSIHITSTEPVAVVAQNTFSGNVEATLVWPVEAWGTEYYNTGLSPYTRTLASSSGYIFIAKENNTTITEYRITAPTTPVTSTLQAGEMFHYFATGTTAMQNRTRVVSNKPIAFFNSGTMCATPDYAVSRYNNTFEQLLPTNTWGTKFVLPSNEINMAFARVTAKESGTTVNVVYPNGTTQTFNLSSGTQADIHVKSTTTGFGASYISSNKPVSVCAVHNFSSTHEISQPGFSWLPPLQQRVRNVYMSPLDPNAFHMFLGSNKHFVSIIVPHATKSSTTISLNGGPVKLIEDYLGSVTPPNTPLKFAWENNGNAIGSSGYAVGRFYFGESVGGPSQPHVPLNTTAMFDHPDGVLAIAWGQGSYTNYFYTVGSTFRDLTAGFTVDGEDYIDVDGRVYCDRNSFELKAYPDTLKNFYWELDGVEIPGTRNVITIHLNNMPDGYYTVNLVANDRDHITHFFVGGGPVIWTPQLNASPDKRTWNNPNNWTPLLVPTSCHNVYIPGNLEDYPLLTGPVACNNIYFMQGAELGRPDRLTYKRAYVQMNFDLKQSPQQRSTNRDLILKSFSTSDRLRFSAANSATPLARERWYMLSSPLQGVVTGDLGYGGFPLTFLMKFGPIVKDGDNYLVGKWTTPYTSMTEPLKSTDGFAFYMYGYGMSGDNLGCVETGAYSTLNDMLYLPLTRSALNYGIRETNGILELPFFEDQTNLNAHRTQVYEGGAINESTFFNIDDRIATFNRLTGTQTSVNREANGGNYRFIPETLVSGAWVFQPIVNHSGANLGGDDEFLVGNPYMSSIDVVELIKDNTATVQDQYRIWNGTTFISYLVNRTTNVVTPSNPGENSRYIAPLQGFFLKTQAGYGGAGNVAKFDVTKISTVRPSGASNLRSSTAAEENILRIKAENNFAASYMLIGYKENASEGFRKGENVQKLFTFLDYVPEIYSLADNIPVDINFISNKGVITVPLGIKIDRTGEIRLTLTGMNNYSKATKIEFIDAKENKTFDLTGKSNYTYTFNHTEKGIQNGRFSIRISHSVTALPKVSPEDLKVYGDSKGIYVVSSTSDPVQQLIVYDLQGRKVFESKTDAKYYPLPGNIGRSPLIVKAITKNGAKTLKVNYKF